MYNPLRVVSELWEERYLGEDRLSYLKWFLAALANRKCRLLKHHNSEGMILCIDTYEICFHCDGTGIDYHFSFKSMINIFENRQRDISLQCYERGMKLC